MCRALLAAVLGGSLLSAGCGGGSHTSVTGKITYQGQPVTSGDITFLPAGSGETASGSIKEDGSYSLNAGKTDPGVLPGSYQVRIASYKTPPQMDQPESGQPAIPARYFDVKTSNLTATVEKTGAQQINFELTD